jgi:hypothetical protein
MLWYVVFIVTTLLWVGRDGLVSILTARLGHRIPWWGGRFSAPVQTGRGAHPTYYTVGTGSLSPGVKRLHGLF